MLEITYAKKALKTLRKMPSQTAKQILGAIEKLAADPARTDLDIKFLQGRDGYRLRVGDWRVIYSRAGIVLAVEKIAPRSKIYK